jgi:flagellin-like protein
MSDAQSELQRNGRERQSSTGPRQHGVRRLATGRGVSPVIGVILMVAITVILSAVIATFVLTIADGQESAPAATFEVEQIKEGGSGDPDEVQITMTQGGPIDADNLYISIASDVQIQESDSASTPGPADRISWANYTTEDRVTAGKSISPVEPENSVGDIDGETIQIIWDGNTDSSVVYEWDAPTD